MLQEIGFGLARDVVGEIVMDYLNITKRLHPFKDWPGYDWWKGSMKRWPMLTDRKPQHLSRKRAEGANEEIVRRFFERVEALLRETGLLYATDLAERLWNYNESGLCNAVTGGKVLTKKGSRWVHDTAGGSGRTYTTIHGSCGSASGVPLPPFIVYKGKHLYNAWTKGGPAGAMYSVSGSGWMEKESYESWFMKMFLPATKNRESAPVVLFFDGHHSHISISLIKVCKENNVHLMLLPSNTTHVLQPLDVGVFGPVKQAWKNSSAIQDCYTSK